MENSDIAYFYCYSDYLQHHVLCGINKTDLLSKYCKKRRFSKKNANFEHFMRFEIFLILYWQQRMIYFIIYVNIIISIVSSFNSWVMFITWHSPNKKMKQKCMAFSFISKSVDRPQHNDASKELTLQITSRSNFLVTLLTYNTVIWSIY